MHISILHNSDYDFLTEDPGREARKDVARVAAALSHTLTHAEVSAEPVAVENGTLAFAEVLCRRQPILVVNLCESLAADSRGEMAVPCLLELLGLPYTGSSALALGLALHKDKAKELLRARSVPTPDFALVRRVQEVEALGLPFPLIVKPVREDASLGVDFDSVVKDRSSLVRAVSQVLATFRQPALVESYVEGREIYVPILGNAPRQTLPLTEIQFGKAFEDRPKIVSYRAKWELDSPECVDSPAALCSLDERTEERIVETALAAFEALDCRDYGRVDLRLGADGRAYVIDINPNCDLHPDAGFAASGAAAGMDYRALALRLVEIALERSYGTSSDRRQGPRIPRRAAAPNRHLFTSRGQLRPRAHRSRAQVE
jgi:D-alanine-D-alanine ligase